MTRILVPLDGSSLAEAVVPIAEALARDYEAELLLVQALRARGSLEAETEAQEEAEGYLAGMAAALRRRGVPGVAWKVWYDEPEQAIASAAALDGVDLVAMSTHGRGGLSRLLFGSVAEGVVRQAKVPVLLVRGQPAPRPGAVGRIVVPLDGSDLSEGVLPIVARLAGPFDFEIDLLQAVEPLPSAALAEVPMHLDGLARLRITDAEGYLAKVAAALEGKGLRVRRAVRHGQPVEVISQYAREVEAGLIAMSTHGRTGLGRLFLGSVAERVLRTAHVPVLLWKPPIVARG